MSFMSDFEHLQVQLKDILLATNNFGDKHIGIGGFGKVYKGELSLPGERRTVAFKRLNRYWGQGDTEFWKEIMMLSQYRHENLICLLHFCREADERILVYEYAARGSLDRYLGDPSLTWTQRLKICLGAAHGLNYLHDPMKTHQRVLHRDIKSANILLDENFVAKVSDFGLSKIGPANQQHSYLVSNVVGTPGYCDPSYWETGILSKESDVYSFGVVLFEVMCGKLCFENGDDGLRILVATWRACYREERLLDDLIPEYLKEQIDLDSLKMFAGIANRCLNSHHKKRPTMAKIIKKLEMSLDFQEMHEDANERIKFEERVMIAEQAIKQLSYKTRNELLSALSTAVLLKGGTRLLSINSNEHNCEAISVKECMLGYRSHCDKKRHQGINDTRFCDCACLPICSGFKIEACTKFLSPNVTYSINLVYHTKFSPPRPCIPFKYKLDGEAEYFTPCVEYREGTVRIVELYHFKSFQKEHNFKIHFLKHPYRFLYSLLHPYYGDDKMYIDSIEFRPLQYEQKKKENLDDENKVDIQTATIDSDYDWEQKLPNDYAEILKCSKDSTQWTTKKELYYLFRKGFPIYNTSEKWFSIDKNMKKCYMLPATTILPQSKRRYLHETNRWILKSVAESRFDVAEISNTKRFDFVCELDKQLLSSTFYRGFLVYKLPEGEPMCRALVKFDSKNHELNYTSHVEGDFRVLALPKAPVIRLTADQDSPIPLRTHGVNGHPEVRKDGWMEIQLFNYKFRDAGPGKVPCSLTSFTKWTFAGMLVQGIELRPRACHRYGQRRRRPKA